MKISPISPNPAPKKEKYPKKAIYRGLLKNRGRIWTYWAYKQSKIQQINLFKNIQYSLQIHKITIISTKINYLRCLQVQLLPFGLISSPLILVEFSLVFRQYMVDILL